MPLARISLTLCRHFSLSFIASDRSSGLHPVSSHSCWMYVRAGRPAFAWPSAGVHWSTSLMSSSLLLPQCPACQDYIDTFPNRSLPPAGLLDYIPYPHIAAVCIFELVVLLLLGNMRGSIAVHHL